MQADLLSVYHREVGAAFDEHLFGKPDRLTPLPFNHDRISYYVQSRGHFSGAAQGKMQPCEHEERFFSLFDTQRVGKQLVTPIGGAGAGKSTFLRYFFQYYLPHRLRLLHETNATKVAVYDRDVGKHIILYADLRRMQHFERFEEYTFPIFAKLLSIADADVVANTWRSIEQLSKQTDDRGERRHYITWVLDNSDQLTPEQLTDLVRSLFAPPRCYLPEQVPTAPPAQAPCENSPVLWRVILPLRPETQVNLNPNLIPVDNVERFFLPPVDRKALLALRGGLLEHLVIQSGLHHETDAEMPTKLAGADAWPFFRLKLPEVAGLELAREFEVNIVDDEEGVAPPTTGEILGKHIDRICPNARKVFLELVNDSARSLLHLYRRAVTSVSFRRRIAKLRHINVNPYVSKYYFLEGLLCGDRSVFDSDGSPLVNFYYHSDGQDVLNDPFAFMLGPHLLYLLNVGRDWAAVKADLLSIGYAPSAVDEWADYLWQREVLRPRWGEMRYTVERAVVRGYSSLFVERSYTDNMALAVQSRFEPDDTPITDSNETSHFILRVKGTVRFLRRFVAAERAVATYRGPRAGCTNFPMFKDALKALKIRRPSMEVCSHYKADVERLESSMARSHILLELREHINRNRGEWEQVKRELIAVYDDSTWNGEPYLVARGDD